MLAGIVIVFLLVVAASPLRALDGGRLLLNHIATSCPHIRHGGWIEVREIDHG